MSDPEASEDLDGQVRRLDPERWLSSRFVADPQARADVVAIYAFDHELGRAPKVASNALLGEIRLTWWREMLDEAYGGGAVRRHPTALALAEAIARRSLPRAPLEAMIDARYRELDPAPMNLDDALEWAEGTGGGAAQAAALALDPAADAGKGSRWRRFRPPPTPRSPASAPAGGAPPIWRAACASSGPSPGGGSSYSAARAWASASQASRSARARSPMASFLLRPRSLAPMRLPSSRRLGPASSSGGSRP